MSACDVDLISRYLDGDLNFPARRALEIHVKSCRPCRDEMVTLRELDARLQRFAAHSVNLPISVERRVNQDVQRKHSLAPVLALSRMMPAAVGSTIAALLVVMSVNLGLYGGRQIDTSGNGLAPSNSALRHQSAQLAKARRSSAILGGTTQLAATQSPALRRHLILN